MLTGHGEEMRCVTSAARSAAIHARTGAGTGGEATLPHVTAIVRGNDRGVSPAYQLDEELLLLDEPATPLA